VQLIDEIFGRGLLDRLAKQDGTEDQLREIRERKRGGPEGTAPFCSGWGSWFLLRPYYSTRRSTLTIAPSPSPASCPPQGMIRM